MDQPRRALVTGTSAGLGRAIATALAREGYDLALTELSADALEDTLENPEIRKRKAVAIALDLRSQESIKFAFERATNELGDPRLAGEQCRPRTAQARDRGHRRRMGRRHR